MATQSNTSIADIVAGAQSFIRTSVESAQKQQSNLEQMGKIAREVASTYNIVAQDLAVVKATEQAAELKVQAEKAKIARAAGVDPVAGANELVTLMEKQRAANKETEAALTEYRKKNEANFFDNPIDYVVAQITLPAAEAKLQGAASSSKLYQEQLTGLNNTLQNSFQTTEKLKESVTATSAEAATRVAAAQAVINAQQSSLEVLKYNNLGIEAAQSASKDQLQAMYTVFNAQKSEQQLKLALNSQALDLERFNWQKAERAEAAAAKKEGKDLDESLVGKINMSRSSLGLPTISGLEAKSAVQLLKSGASKELAYHYENGNRILATGQATVGATPAESVEVLSQIPNNLPDIRKETSQVLSAAMEALAQAEKGGKKDKKAADAFVNKFVTEAIAEQYNTIVPNSQNLFDVGDLKSYLTLSGIAELPVVSKFLAPAAAAGQPLNDPKLVLGFMQDAIKKGTLTTSEISGLATVYQKANLINQSARGFVGFGIVPPNAGRNYNARISQFGKPVDMTDPVAVQTYISRELAKTMGNRIAEERLASPFLTF